MIVLGIETSCDETAVALVREGREILSSSVATQVARHRPFGGVVPEIAAREHVLAMLPVLKDALGNADIRRSDISAIAVTERPGLQAALLSGTAAAQALSVAWNIPVVGVNHIEAHLVAPFLAESRLPEWPLLSLVVSGGHTHLFLSRHDLDHQVIGATADDAAGEAFDKVAKILGLGYPGGPAIQKAAESGDPKAFSFPRPRGPGTGLNFSFSGLKTAVAYAVLEREANGRPTDQLRADISVPDVAASFQAAVVDVLTTRLDRAVKATGIRTIALGGGVACNEPLRARIRVLAHENQWTVLVAPPALCTDNAAMVAARGSHLLKIQGADIPPLSVAARASWPRLTLAPGT